MGRASGLTNDRHDRCMVELGVVQTVEQVDGTRSAGGRADPDPAAELGVTARLEGGHLLAPGLDEPRLVAGSLPGRENAVDPVPGIAEDLSTPHSRKRWRM